MKKCLIISAGDKFIPEIKDYQYIIACDGGYDYCLQEGIHPDLVIGDFDSVKSDITKVNNKERFKVEKDDTDTMLAIRHAIADDYDEITLCCALGGRFDHTIANIQSLHFIVSANKKAMLIGENTIITAYKEDELIFPVKDHWSLSVFALEDKAEVSINDAYYTMDHGTMTSDFPIGVSNKWCGKPIHVISHCGAIMVIESLVNH